MKKSIILSAIALSGLIYTTANAQIGIHFGFHISTPNVYIPSQLAVEQAQVYEQPAPQRYHSNEDYYYLPDVDAYYSVNGQCYYYFNGDSWIAAAYLPGEYRDYDWRSARRFEVRSERPYLRDDIYRSRYHGHEVSEWRNRSYNDHFDGGYDDRGYGNGDHHSFNREQVNQYESAQPNRGRNDYGQHFDNYRRGGYDHPSDNRGQDGYNQPEQPSYDHGGYNQRSDNRQQGGYNQSSGQNGGGPRDNKGDGEHFSHNSPKGGFDNHKMAKF